MKNSINLYSTVDLNMLPEDHWHKQIPGPHCRIGGSEDGREREYVCACACMHAQACLGPSPRSWNLRQIELFSQMDSTGDNGSKQTKINITHNRREHVAGTWLVGGSNSAPG